MRLDKIVFLTVFLLLLTFIPCSFASAENNEAVLHIFWSNGCPHCASEKEFLSSIQPKYPGLVIESHEVSNKEEAQLFYDMCEAYETQASGVPTTFLGEKVWVGYASYIGEQIESEIERCIEKGCIDPLEKLNNQDQENPIEIENLCIHVFLQEDCSQCNATSKYLDELNEKYGFQLKKYYVSKPENKELYETFKETYGLIDAGYPIVFIGEKYLIGETSIEKNLENEIIKCSKKDCPCPVKGFESITPTMPGPDDITPENNSVVQLPVIGKIDTENMSLPVFTVIIAGLDSFNPCAFFVLFFLLSMLIYARSRKRMLIIGGTFVFFSAFLYFLFMAAWLNLFLVIGQLKAITIIAGIVALVIAIINIKDFFFFKKGVSLTISDKAKPNLFKRMRNLLKADSLSSMVFGAVVLAIVANSYELLCTAGFPMVFTRILTLNELPKIGYYSYLVLYNLIYVIPLTVIVLIFTITLGARKLTEEQGESLKLISGIMMLCLGLVLLINPAWLNNVVVAVSILGISLAVSLTIIFIKKRKKEV
jgi:glutaredoxin